MSKSFILASASPRRRELFESSGFEFKIVPSDADEALPDGIGARDAVAELSKRKAFSVIEKCKNDCVVLGCDTVVALSDSILGKPSDESEAKEMLRMLSGKSHHVFTGVCITDGSKTVSFVSETQVEFYELSDKIISEYVKTGEPMDKAGAYGIQGLGGLLVKRINGDYYTVVGLPLARCIRELAEFGIFGSLRLKP